MALSEASPETPGSTPLSLHRAAAELYGWITEQRNAQPQPQTAQRLEMEVRPPHRSALTWLQSQPHPQKLFFRGRGAATREVAAVGFAHVASGPSFSSKAHLSLVQLLNPSYPKQRFYGATRFSPDTTISAEWAPYQGYTFVLPAIELSRDADGVFCLAMNYISDGYAAIQAALAALVATPADPVLLPRAVSAVNLTPFSSWDAAMTVILSAIRARQYEKIVLARRKRFTFYEAAAPSPIAVLIALDAQNAHSPAASRHSSYLFCLQLDAHHAFLGCPPERLFHLEGRNILTEALAGTVRRSTDGNEGEVLSELLSVKNLEEHRFVVDYIRTALASCRVTAQTSGPHVRRLPRLMHLATNIQGQFPTTSAQEDSTEESPQSNVYRLLRTMHPTPAVCGMPREQTIAELPQLEDFDRGFFAGPLGWFSRDAGEFSVAIRTALVNGCTITAFAGSGIVQASESQSEWDETELKMSAFTDLFLGPSPRPAEPDTNGYVLETAGSNEPDERLFQDETKYLENCPHNQVGDARVSSVPPFGDSSQLIPRVNGLKSAGNSSLPSKIPSSDSLSSLQTVRPMRPSRQASASFDPSNLHAVPNLNTLWGCCCVEELCRNGVSTFFVAPGSRSAPLAVGVAKSRHANSFVAHDERGAGFLAVGYARATGRAAAVITSSGTAVANLLPAVVEAAMDSLPMVMLTADRPPELRDVGANQAIYQPGIFGTYVRWSKDVPCPNTEIPLRNLLSDVDYAVRLSGSGIVRSLVCNGPADAGPVHLNMMFREKLAPDLEAWSRGYIAEVGSKWQQSLMPMTQYEFMADTRILTPHACELRHRLGKIPGMHQTLIDCLAEKEAGVIIVGGGDGSICSEDEGLALYAIADFFSWPVIPDVCSGLRFDKRPGGDIVHYADQILTSQGAARALIPDAVLQFGERITSKRLLDWITKASRRDDFVHIMVSPSTTRCDPSFTVTHRLHSTISCFFAVLGHPRPYSSPLENRVNGNPSKLMLLKDISAKVDDLLEEILSGGEKNDLSEPCCARVVSEALERPSALFIGNSMPIRDFDAFASATKNGIRIKVAANRGASGIDGIISSGIGFGIGLDLDVTIVLGDMSMIHDMNALHLLRSQENDISVSVTIVVVNNGGGGIFSMLPIAKHRDVFSPSFDTPHSVQFKEVCETFGLNYKSVQNAEDLRQALKHGRAREHRMIEVLVPRDHASNAALHQRLGAAVSQQVSTFFATKA